MAGVHLGCMGQPSHIPTERPPAALRKSKGPVFITSSLLLSSFQRTRSCLRPPRRGIASRKCIKKVQREARVHWPGSLLFNYLLYIISSKSLAVYWQSFIIEVLPRAGARFSGARAGAYSWKLLDNPQGEWGASRVAGHPLRIHLLIVGFCGSLRLVGIQSVVLPSVIDLAVVF
jgi:hypothetical protein